MLQKLSAWKFSLFANFSLPFDWYLEFQGLLKLGRFGYGVMAICEFEARSKWILVSSMGRSSNCYDNAYMKSFFGTLKTELVHGERYRSRLEARLSIFEIVEAFYDPQRSHSALGYRSPEPYEKFLNET